MPPIDLENPCESLKNPRFDASFTRLFGEHVTLTEGSEDFFVDFYERFLQDPEVRALFAHTDMQQQVQMLQRSLMQLVSFGVVMKVTAQGSPELRRLAVLHRKLGIPARLFERWEAALLATVAEHDPECDEATLLAWCWALAPGMTFMRLAMHDATL